MSPTGHIDKPNRVCTGSCVKLLKFRLRQICRNMKARADCTQSPLLRTIKTRNSEIPCVTMKATSEIYQCTDFAASLFYFESHPHSIWCQEEPMLCVCSFNGGKGRSFWIKLCVIRTTTLVGPQQYQRPKIFQGICLLARIAPCRSLVRLHSNTLSGQNHCCCSVKCGRNNRSINLQNRGW